MSSLYVSQFFTALIEFCDTFTHYFMYIGSMNNSEFHSFLFARGYTITITNNFNQTLVLSGMRYIMDDMLFYIENALGILGDLVSAVVDLGLDVVNFMYDLIFVPIFVPSGYTADTIPFFYTFIGGVFIITFVSGVFTAVLKPMKSLITFK